jgi:hypothetical protein
LNKILLEKHIKIDELDHHDVNMTFASVVMCFAIQFFAILILFLDQSENYDQATAATNIVLSTFIIIVLLHYTLSLEVETALKELKYLALNYEHFEYPIRAYFCAVLQIVSIYFLETMLITSLLVQPDIMQTIQNFT